MKKAFLAYFTLGYPTLSATEEVIKGAIDGGATGIEIGIPFSDPVADGKTIQHAHHVALTKGVKSDDVLTLLERLGPYKEKADFYIMAYLNSIMNAPGGMDTFLKKAKDFEVKGLIIPDLPFSEVKRGRIKIDFPLVLFATPDTGEAYIKEYPLYKPPFIYYIARYGTTGERDSLPEDLTDKLVIMKKLINIPIYIGFGISKPEHVKTLYKVVDGVIVGSHLIRLIIKNEEKTPEILREIIRKEVEKLLSY